MKINGDNKAVTACFTGHRPDKLQKEKLPLIAETLNRELAACIRGGHHRFICGMSRGFDLMCARAVLKAKWEYPNVFLELALPHADQADHWNEADKAAYLYIIERADLITCLSPKYVQGCMHARNRYMIDNSSLLIAYFDGTPGGTASTVELAEKREMEIHNLFHNVEANHEMK
jgi:uncharacterized phage-like protein YoqJ